MRLQLAGPEPAAADAGSLRPALHHARRDDDLPLRRARPVGLLQLPVAAAARRARHGVPAPERALLLDLPGRRPLPLRRLRRRPRARRRLVQLRPLRRQGLQSRRQHRHLRARPDPAGHLDHRRRGQLRRHLPAAARARHVGQPRADPDLGHADRLGRQPAGGAGGQPGLLPAVDGPPVRHPLLRRGAAASRCSGSTCSGCSAIPGSTPSCCRRWAWSPTACRPSAAGRWSATRRWRWRPWRPWRSASASGCTTCSRPALPAWPPSFFSGASIDHHHPERGGGVRLDRDDLDRPAGDHHRVPVLRQHDRAVRASAASPAS